MINWLVYTIFLQLCTQVLLESMGKSCFKSLPAQGQLCLEESPQRRGGLLAEFLFHSGLLTHISSEVCAHTCVSLYEYKYTHPCTPGTTPALQGTSGSPVTCFGEAELICLVMLCEPQGDGEQVWWDWGVSRPSSSFTLPLWNTPCNINTASHAHTYSYSPFCSFLFLRAILASA